ncbi:MAG TPA: non-canonical purine NTP pyrophosphatase [Candidatus Saccharimonadales bacterium]|jgi:non-canonical purine NTP pyrophosphatase (RdgB/HAM1 family)|nr:non-canonical purine NTP pyrophosphatase [Candidatus Saccharimonadales bacterium]
MQRLPVDSSDIVSVGYDPKTRLLEIEFKEGRIYEYPDVEPETYRLFMKADSYGQFFLSSINGHYRYNRIDKDGRKQAGPQSLAFVTGNARKVRDLQTALAPFHIEAEQLDLPVDEIQSHDPEAVVLAKAKDAFRLAGRPVAVNDTFWNILALRGFPGAYMSYVADWFKPEDFLKLLQDKTDRTVIGTDTLVYYDGDRSKVFSQNHTGTIATEPRGKGASIDQLLIINGETKTVAEVHEQEGRSCIDPDNNIWHDFAKWYNMQRRLGKV